MAFYLPIVVCIVGLVIYLVSNHPKANAIALHMFWVGLAVFLLNFGHR